ncbi:type II toxin-antitoxin system HicB family antitoxin [Brachyspira intermedia]|uniref:type II toxin-antitoxin system HicB family antitoxin n=1 Tax=Brachyspira intermedia TaxID=84377 RepID=UPI0030060976
MIINTIIEKDENGYFAFVPELKGCVSEGETFEEVKSNIKEAIELYLETMSEDELNQLENKDYSITPIEVAVER